jgi:RNA polymerase sigma-70 factor (ECF subfamily)
MCAERALNPAQILGFARAEAPRTVPLEEVVVEAYVSVRPALLGYLYQIVGSTGEAEDLVQITFLKLFDQLRKNAEILELRGWLYKVAHNLAIDSLRTRGREEATSTEWLDERTAPGDSVEQNLIRKQQVRQILGALNERERRCLLLRAEGLSYKEIADVLDISAKSVSVYLARGLKKVEGRKA